jgi:hypothetical protein
MKTVSCYLCLLSCALWLPLPCPAQTAARPNVLIIISDDQGYGELSAHGNPLPATPQLDRLRASAADPQARALSRKPMPLASSAEQR